MRRRISSDDDLIRAVTQGDSIAVAELLKRHRHWVVRVLHAFTHSTDEAEDLAQEVFTRMYRHAGSYRTRGGFVPWLRRIAINTGNSYLQKRKTDAFVSLTMLTETPAQGGIDPLQHVLEQSLESAVYEAIATLPGEQREAILLRCFMGQTIPEIARVQQCPEGTVKSRLSNGLKKVRQTLTANWDEEESSQ